MGASKKFLRGLLGTLPQFFPEMPGIAYMVERQAWVIREDGKRISQAINASLEADVIKISSRPFLNSRRILHFGSQFMCQDWFSSVSANKKVIVNFYHGNFGDGPEIDSNLDFLRQNQKRMSTVITSNRTMAERLRHIGVTYPKIAVIPIGIDLDVFSIADDSDREKTRSQLGLPTDRFVIGSFQKDGIGWGRGINPKLIKGPDILVETARLMNLQVPVFILLSGPSRGYVMQELSRLRIPFRHLQMKYAHQVATLYHGLDAYVVSSREEGGPKGLLEALASGTSVASTPVGMAPDLVGVCNGLQVTNNLSPEALADALLTIGSQSPNMNDRRQLRDLVRHCAWELVGKSHWNDIYLPLLEGEQ